MKSGVLQIVQIGLGVSLQDQGRLGWRRFGVPLSGVMDTQAATWANRLLDNPPGSPLLEFLWHGARISFLRDTWVALTGADASCALPRWRAVRVRNGDVMEFPLHRSGVWVYLAIEGGLMIPEWLGSRSTYAPAGLGKLVEAGDIFERGSARPFSLPPGVSSRLAPAQEQRDYHNPPALRVWPGPQTANFTLEDLNSFFSKPWAISSQCNRVGYRLEGQPLRSSLLPWSEPMRVGTIQIPDNGQPIVMMRDGPTVGGYPKLGVVDDSDLGWLAQCCPGQRIRFAPAGLWPGVTA